MQITYCPLKDKSHIKACSHMQTMLSLMQFWSPFPLEFAVALVVQFKTPCVNRLRFGRDQFRMIAPEVSNFPRKGHHLCSHSEDMGRGRGGGEGAGRVDLPASRTVYSRFPPPFAVVPTSVCFFCCEILHNVAKLFPVSPTSRPLF